MNTLSNSDDFRLSDIFDPQHQTSQSTSEVKRQQTNTIKELKSEPTINPLLRWAY